jgi:hypothetical protein
MNRLFPSVLVCICALPLVYLSSCVSIGRITNLQERPCADSLQQRVTQVLIAQGEPPQYAAQAAQHTLWILANGYIGRRPFLASTPDADYGFFIELRQQHECLLRLFSIHKGFWRYTNNLTYIDTREVPTCFCEE